MNAVQPGAASPASAAPAKKPVPTNPYVGILGVFLGAGLATLNARLISVGLPDLRGAIGLGVDEASWIPTALNMATMFSGVFIVFVNVLLGPRRILLPAAAIFTIASAVLPFASGYWQMIALVVIAGLTSGTFYSLTMTFVLTALPKRLIIFGIAAYAADIVFISNFASAIEGWYIEHLSWHWIFWTAAVFTPLMMLCVYFGIPRQKVAALRPSWQGFAFFSLGLSLLYGAMDQGERLDWFNSGTIVAMSAAGAFLVAAAGLRRLFQPNPTLNLSFLNKRNVIIIALSIFVFKFEHLATVVLVPAFLGNIQHYRPLETGHALAWVAAPMFAVVWLVAFLVIYTSSRLILSLGLALAGVLCWFCSHLDTSWAGNSFQMIELFLAVGFACTYVGLVSSIVLEGLDAGILGNFANTATFSGFMHFVRIFGGQIGVAAMMRFISVREQFHSNLLGLHVQLGGWLTDERIRMLTAGLASGSVDPEEAQHRAVAILGGQVRAQAYTMAIADAFLLISWMVVAYLLLMLFLRPGKLNYQILRKNAMNRTHTLALAGLLTLCAVPRLAAETRHLTLTQAVHLAINQNHALKIARLKVVENQQKKAGDHSEYFPRITNQSNVLHVTELQTVVIPAGGLGTPVGVLIPPESINLLQGKNTLFSSGTQLSQPLTQLIRIHAANRIAAAEVAASRDDLKKAENEVAIQVHTLYFGVLITRLEKQAAEQQRAYAGDYLRESEEDVRNGSALNVSLIQGRAGLLESQQSVLTADLQLSDLNAELNDLLGLPLDTQLDLDSAVRTSFDLHPREEYIKTAWSQKPEILAAEETVKKARGGVTAAKSAYIPDVTAFARQSYQDGVPFLLHNFGTFGVNLSYDVFDFGKRRSAVREREAQLAQAEENLTRLKDQVAVAIEKSYNKLERTKNLIQVADQVVKLRQESERLAQNQLKQGILLASDRRQSTAATYKAQADYLQASLGHLLAWAELEEAVGQTPGLE